MSEIDLSVNIGKLKLNNPVILASGTAGYGNELSEFIDLNKIGAIITKSVSLKKRKGNPPQRITESPAGMLNAIGLANVGIEEFINSKIPFLENFNVPVICNIAASTVDEYVECVNILKNENAIRAFEINVSCPNVKEGGLQFGNDLKQVVRITNLVRAATDKTVIIKLSPNNSNISEFAKAVKNEGADAVTAVNTFVATAFNIFTKKPKIKNITGGLSGPAIKPIALAKVFEIHQSVNIPIIASGGIMNWKDAVEYMIAGASAFQIGTLNFIDPAASIKMIEELKDYCKKMNINKISDLTGSYILE